MKKVLILSIIVIVFICGCSKSNEDQVKIGVEKISCETKDEYMKGSNTVLVDVRSDDEYKEGHLSDAINIPYDSILEGAKESGIIDMNTKIIVYCKSGKRSSIAASELSKAGYKYIYDLGAMSNCSK